LRAHALVSDFDGTITRNDFYLLIAERYMGPEATEVWDSYRAGKITHFEAMQAFFSHAPDDEQSLESLLSDVHPDPHLRDSWQQLADHDWDLIIVSAGSSWYIDKILQRAGIPAAVHSNPGEIVPGRGLVMRPPVESQFYCPDVGVDKQAVVRDALARYDKVAFAGDGPPDIKPALLVSADRRFARGFLADELQRRGQMFNDFNAWSDIVASLVAGAET